jgi:sucrose phosphorylase
MKWLNIAPKNCITVLDTHDGIGIIDVGPMDGKPGLLSEQEIDHLVETIHVNSNGESQKATGAAASNVDLYQVNCTYYDALGKSDYDYLLARAIQFFSPGTPQVYYAGLLAETNQMNLLAKTNVGRDINRPYLDETAIKHSMQKSFVKALSKLIKLRNTCLAFNGTFSVSGNDNSITMVWQHGDSKAALSINLQEQKSLIDICSRNENTSFELTELLTEEA